MRLLKGEVLPAGAVVTSLCCASGARGKGRAGVGQVSRARHSSPGERLGPLRGQVHLPASATGRAQLNHGAHLEVIQHLLPRQEQQCLLADLPGDLGVEEGVLSAAIRHPLWGREKSRVGTLANSSLAQGRKRASGGTVLGPRLPTAPGTGPGWLLLLLQPLGYTSLPRESIDRIYTGQQEQQALPPEMLEPNMSASVTEQKAPKRTKNGGSVIPNSPQVGLRSCILLYYGLLQRPGISLGSEEGQSSKLTGRSVFKSSPSPSPVLTPGWSASAGPSWALEGVKQPPWPYPWMPRAPSM